MPEVPATQPRPRTPAARRIVAAAEELFYECGITAVGVDLIAERSGVTKRTLYNQFGSKDQVVVAYLEERDRRWRELVRAAVDASGTAADAVTAPFEALRTWSGSNPRGCAFINALAEFPDTEHPAHRIAAVEKLWLRHLFAELATVARCARPEELATRLLVLHEGVVATQPLALDVLPETVAVARSLVRAGAEPDEN